MALWRFPARTLASKSATSLLSQPFINGLIFLGGDGDGFGQPLSHWSLKANHWPGLPQVAGGLLHFSAIPVTAPDLLKAPARS